MSEVSMGEPRGIRLAALLDQQRLGPMQITVVGLCLLAMLIDGYDVYMFGTALPVIARSFAVPPSALTGVIVAQNVGLVVGTFVAGPISDRYGRKVTLILCVIAFGLFTLATARAHTLMQMTVLRFAAAIFFSGVIPNAVALASEMAPLRFRSGLVAFIFCGYAGGTAIGGFVNGALLATHRWPLIFIIGGILPLCLAIPFALFLPESLRFRARRDPRDPHIARLLKRMDPGLSLTGEESFDLGEESDDAAQLAVSELFVRKRRRLTLLLWLCFALSLGGIATMAAWTATVLNAGIGLPIAEVGSLIGVSALAGLFGTGSSGFIMDRIGAGRTLFLFYAGTALCMLALSVANFHSTTIFVLMAAMGYCGNSAQGALNAFSSSAYPTRMRATGVGWAFAAGRTGGIIGPIIGGTIIAGGHSGGAFYVALTLPMLLVALAVPFMTRAFRKAFTTNLELSI
jgi:MFS transporter, AAHS family, 4-hydroxybenzoate transporter